MKLPTKDLSATLSALRANPAGRTDLDQRIHGRIDVEAPVTVTCFWAGGEAKTVVALLRNLSSGGVGLLLGEPLRAGEDEIVIYLPQANGEGLYICCLVLHCQPIATGMYRVGAVFDAILSERSALMICPPAPRAA